MAKKQAKVTQTNETESAGSTQLAELLQAKGFQKSETAEKESAKSSSDSAKTGGIRLEKMPKLLLRHERKGRGGKTVTLVSGFIAAPPQIEALAREMRKALGVGATVEKGVIILQGDVTTRAADWLKKHGALQVVVGN